ncbi:MAG: endolytic transglycosylase MltG [Deltaproteobacteria bacterium]
MTVPRRSLPLLAALSAAALVLVLAAARPFPGNWELKKVRIPPGSGYPEIVRILTEGGVLRFPAVFRILVAATGTATALHHGEYVFPSPPSAYELWRKITSGDVARYPVTIPEGATLYDIARILGQMELADPDSFLLGATSGGMASRLDIPGDTTEGFLFPDTYLFVKDMRVEEILRVMVRRFHEKFTSEMEQEAAAKGLTIKEVVTIASIIEKETGIEAEKPLISSVIHRRLRRGMPLQMDPTVIYGLKKFNGNLTRRDLRADNPYNTYRNAGLPPGPISNPGLSSLVAALHPADTRYLYFVSRNDGSHKFSRTLREHNRAVEVYQKNGGRKPARKRKPANTGGKPGAIPPPPEREPS